MTQEPNWQDPESIIRANQEAEALESDKLKETAEAYALQLEEMMALQEKNMEIFGQLRQMHDETARQIRVLSDIAEGSKTQENLTKRMQQSDDFSHRENVRVYRNIQASTDQMLQNLMQQIREEVAPLKEPAKQKTPVLQILILAGIAAVLVLQVWILIHM